MLLGLLMAEQPSKLRADLQQYYNVDLDAARAGGHSAAHVAALVAELPQTSRCRLALNIDNRWTLETSLLATLINVVGAVFGGKGAKPLIDLPGADTSNDKTITGVTMDAAQLMQLLAKPRTACTSDEIAGGADG